MAAKYLIDTSVVIKYLNQTLSDSGSAFIDSFIDEDCTISFISEIELQVWNPTDPNDIKVYEQFVSRSNIIGIDKEIISETILIRKNFRLKIADALIAATALRFDWILLADNDKDFERVPSLKYKNPVKI